MTHRFLFCVLGLTALAAALHGQASRTWTPPRTSDGHPGLQGFWSNNNATPVERPKELAGRGTLTDQEVAAMKRKAHELFGDNVFLAVYSNVKGTKTGFKSTDGETGDYSSV